MDFTNNIKQFSEKIAKLKDHVTTEEATKTSLIMPFFQQILGYDVFNPQEFVPEYSCSFGVKKDARIDYAILREGKPSILVEAKCVTEDICSLYDSQLAMCIFRSHPDTHSGNIRTAFRKYPDSISAHPDTLSK